MHGIFWQSHLHPTQLLDTHLLLPWPVWSFFITQQQQSRCRPSAPNLCSTLACLFNRLMLINA